MKKQPGQILVLFALMAPMLTTFVGLAVDGGFWLGRHQRARAAADLAALNGAYCIIEASNTLCTAANALGTNGRGMALATASVNGYPAGGDTTVTATNPTTD